MTAKSLFLCAALSAGAAATFAAHPAVQQISTTSDLCRGDSWGDREGVCEVREYTVAATGATLAVDARPNGGIKVNGEARADVHVLAKVVANAETKERARQIANSVQVTVTADKVSATGPGRGGDREGWSVSYQIAAPERTSLSLETTNGGISIAHMDGNIDFTTVNGGVKLTALSGKVHGRTSNGGIDVDLEGPTWQGEGLDVETRNGGVRLSLPADYSAHLQTGTVNGGVRNDFAAPTQEHRRERSIDTQLGGGGPLIHVKTTNGGISVRKK